MHRTIQEHDCRWLSMTARWPADADKRGYAGYFEQLLRLVRHGGVIAVDNILWCVQGKVQACMCVSDTEPAS